MIESLAGYGLTTEQIADCLGWDPSTVQKHGTKAMQKGSAIALARVAKTLYEMATDGTNIAATIFYLKARGKGQFRETERVEVDLPLSPLITHKEKPMPPTIETTGEMQK